MARIVVIEDDPASLELMRYLLDSFGHDVGCAADGASGLAAVLARRPDLIICDVQLPDTDGLEIARRLKSDPQLRSIPLIAVTASAMVEDRRSILAAGFDVYMAKPITPESFVREIEAVARAAGVLSA